MIAEQLDVAIKKVCPIFGVSIVDDGDKSTWRIDFKTEATDQQRETAKAALDAFDPNDPRDAVLAQLSEIDQKTGSVRWVRELALGFNELVERIRAHPDFADVPPCGPGMAKVQAVEDMAIALRKQLAPK